ncbi:MAG: carboxylesterase family protein [Gemmatimonadota bacterium]|nr:carboxylesterase family protein [Gemmatimonadota bacterium]
MTTHRIPLACLLLAALAACSTSSHVLPVLSPSGRPVVTTDAGALSGIIDPASGVFVFKGVPYAAPPVGDGRWRAPGPLARWTGVRSAEKLGKNCIQDQIYSDIDPFAAGVSEDCLYVNVWTQTISTTANRPVMVWIYGGGYTAGFGGEERHNGSRLAQKGAVVVTINYRLGVFGFLAHPALAAESPVGASGNYAIMDQVAALRWVQRNIARFGGDPAKVTIFGESAGGNSVGALIASPLAKGLFRAGIMQSGNAIGSGRPRDDVSAEGARFAWTLGIDGRGSDAAAKLRAIPADSLQRATRKSDGKGGFTSVFATRMVRDGWVLPTTVDSALLRGTANLVPIIIGATGGEGDNAYATARSFARLNMAQNHRAYLYLFTRVGDDSVNRKRGAYHSADITFTFGIPHPLQASAGRTPYDSTLADAMSDYWVSFATSLDPNGPPNAGKLPHWPVYDARTDAYLELGPEIAARSGYRRVSADSLDLIGRRRGDVRP